MSETKYEHEYAVQWRYAEEGGNEMNLTIEIIDGVAYAEVGSIPYDCNRCVFHTDEKKCEKNVPEPCFRYMDGWCHYRRLTAKEREEIMKAIGRGME